MARLSVRYAFQQIISMMMIMISCAGRCGVGQAESMFSIMCAKLLLLHKHIWLGLKSNLPIQRLHQLFKHIALFMKV